VPQVKEQNKTTCTLLDQHQRDSLASSPRLVHETSPGLHMPMAEVLLQLQLDEPYEIVSAVVRDALHD